MAQKGKEIPSAPSLDGFPDVREERRSACVIAEALNAILCFTGAVFMRHADRSDPSPSHRMEDCNRKNVRTGWRVRPVGQEPPSNANATTSQLAVRLYHGEI